MLRKPITYRSSHPDDQISAVTFGLLVIMISAVLILYLAWSRGPLWIPALLLICSATASLPLLNRARRTFQLEEWRRHLVASWPDLMFETDAEGRLIRVSDAASGVLGVPTDRLIGQPLADFLAVDLTALGHDLHDQVLPWRKGDGSIHRMSTTLVPLSQSAPLAVRGIAGDASRFEEALAAQRRAEARIGAFVDALPNGVMLICPAGGWQRGNARFGEFFNVPVEDLNNLPVAAILPREAVEEISALLGGSALGITASRTIELAVASGVRPRRLQLSMEAWSLAGEPPGVLIEAVDVTDRTEHAAELLRLAESDPLTGLPNRYKVEQLIASRIEKTTPLDASLGVLLIDVDRFKLINDTLGHHMGDRLLSLIAERIVKALPSNHVVARFGGDEFVVVTGPVHDSSDAARSAAAVSRCLAEPFEIDGHRLQSAASVGVSLFPSDGADGPTLLRKADVAMYRAKELGGNGYQLCNYTSDVVLEGRLSLESDLRRAVTRGEFVMYYMPEMDIETGRFSCVEALIRWEHPDKGLISPSGFVPLLEDLDLIGTVGEWALEQACRQAVAWNALGAGDVRVAVNLSPKQLRSADLSELVQNVLERTALPADLLELEVTESATLLNAEQAVLTLGELRRLGVHVALDDFGTGHSSLTRLRQLPIDVLKVDRSFVADLLRDSDAHAIVSGVVALGHAMGLKVVAEGIESDAQLRALAKIGCDLAQGFLVSHPLPDDACLTAIGAQQLVPGPVLMQPSPHPQMIASARAAV